MGLCGLCLHPASGIRLNGKDTKLRTHLPLYFDAAGYHEFKENKTPDGYIWPDVPGKESKSIQEDGKSTKNKPCGGESCEAEIHGVRPRKVLLTDITYIPYQGTFAYLLTVLGAYTKQILSYVLSDYLEVDFVLETVKKLVENHGIELTKETLVHSDQGCHYTSTSFIRLVNDKELRQSMSRKGNCWDNAPQESFFGHMKDEIDVSGCSEYREVKAIIDDWMDYYNNERYQWQLAKLSPNEYYEYITTGTYPLKGVIKEPGGQGGK